MTGTSGSLAAFENCAAASSGEVASSSSSMDIVTPSPKTPLALISLRAKSAPFSARIPANAAGPVMESIDTTLMSPGGNTQVSSAASASSCVVSSVADSSTTTSSVASAVAAVSSLSPLEHAANVRTAESPTAATPRRCFLLLYILFLPIRSMIRMNYNFTICRKYDRVYILMKYYAHSCQSVTFAHTICRSPTQC